MIELNIIHHSSWENRISEISDASVDLIVTDPPFDMKVNGGGILYTKKRLGKTFSKIKEYSGDGFDVKPYLKQCKRIMKKMNAYFFCNNKMIKTYLDFAAKNKYTSRVLLWHKQNPLPLNNGNYLYDCEYVIFIREKGVTFNVGLPMEKYWAVQNFARPQGIPHPNAKPLQLIKNYIEISSNEGEIVFDGFAGSGTIPLAALQLNRQFIAFERDITYHSLGTSRIKNLLRADRVFAQQTEIF